MSTNSSLGTALVTGASSGIGAQYVEQLAERGYDIVMVARSKGRMEALAQRLRTSTGRTFRVVAADLAEATGVRLVAQLLETDPTITMLVNNAGVGSAARLLNADMDKMDEMIAININALTRLSHAVAPAFVERGAGTIVNIASIVAVRPELLNGVYGGSKAYVLAFSQSLQHELGPKGVRVQAVLPGATRTEFWDVAGVEISELPADWVMPADEMVRAALAALDQGEFATIPSLPDQADWQALEDARNHLAPNLSHSSPAERYGVAVAA